MNKATKRARVNPGLAGVGSLVGVLIVSLALGVFSFAGVALGATNSRDGWITQTAPGFAGRPWGRCVDLRH